MISRMWLPVFAYSVRRRFSLSLRRCAGRLLIVRFFFLVYCSTTLYQVTFLHRSSGDPDRTFRLLISFGALMLLYPHVESPNIAHYSFGCSGFSFCFCRPFSITRPDRSSQCPVFFVFPFLYSTDDPFAPNVVLVLGEECAFLFPCSLRLLVNSISHTFLIFRTAFLSSAGLLKCSFFF